MRPRIAIPVPHSQKPEYNERCLPHYKHAIESAGGEPVVIPMGASNEDIAKIISTCQGVLLPGSPADVDPEKFNQPKDPHTNPADIGRDNADELLLQDAYNMKKPLFGICYGLQALNVWRSGTLKQHIEPQPVNHEAGSKVPVAHQVKLDATSRVAQMIHVAADPQTPLPVNSSHHQSADVIGDGLRAVAVSAEDGIIEAVEGTDPTHFVLAVQWHPERGFDNDPASQALFKAFIEEAKKYKPKEAICVS
jgi:putative glutamine amidotransferase